MKGAEMVQYIRLPERSSYGSQVLMAPEGFAPHKNINEKGQVKSKFFYKCVLLTSRACQNTSGKSGLHQPHTLLRTKKVSPYDLYCSTNENPGRRGRGLIQRPKDGAGTVIESCVQYTNIPHHRP